MTIPDQIDKVLNGKVETTEEITDIIAEVTCPKCGDVLQEKWVDDELHTICHCGFVKGDD